MGIDAHQLCAEVGLPAVALTDPDVRVSVEPMCRMYELAAKRSGVEDFGLRVGARRRLSNLGAVGLVLREQPTMRKVIATYDRFRLLNHDAYNAVLQEFDDHAVLRMYGPPWQQRQAAELLLTVALRVLQAIVPEGWKPLEIWFTHAAPARLDTYRRVLGMTPRFDQDCMALVIHRKDLDAPIPTADPAIARQLVQYLDRLTAERSVALHRQVSDLIMALLPDGLCTVERVAQHLGVDRRTLHRRLLAEGTTFSRVLDATRKEMAASLLAQSDRPLQSVADLLGFSSASAFAHWFRRKFGRAASAWRAANAEGPPRAASGPIPA